MALPFRLVFQDEPELFPPSASMSIAVSAAFAGLPKILPDLIVDVHIYRNRFWADTKIYDTAKIYLNNDGAREWYSNTGRGYRTACDVRESLYHLGPSQMRDMAAAFAVSLTTAVWTWQKLITAGGSLGREADV